MNVLLTNIYLDDYCGTEVYVRDLAIELHNRGIHVEVYSPQTGKVAEDIRKAGINVADTPDQLLYYPDIIHGHHFEPTVKALEHFPGVPALYLIHDRTNPLDTPVKHSRVLQYLASDQNTLDRLIIDEGIPATNTAVLLNWVDTKKFLYKERSKEAPKKVLVFSNYASDKNYLPVLKHACKVLNLELDTIGLGVGNPMKDPESVLRDYDIVFAKAKAAMEALATGAAVITCDARGLGEMVTTRNYRHFRDYNFGMKTLTRPITEELVAEEIKKYDPVEAGKVSGLIREEACLQRYVDTLLGYYQEVIKKFRENAPVNREAETQQHANQLLSDKLVKQQEYVRYLEAQVTHYNQSFFKRVLRWLNRKNVIKN